MIDLKDLMKLQDVADYLELLSQTDNEIIPLKVGTLSHYVLPTDSPHSRIPRLNTIKLGNAHYATHADVVQWVAAYKTAPKLGRRGDGSKQPKNKKTVRPSKGIRRNSK